jgi:hypothetical protein
MDDFVHTYPLEGSFMEGHSIYHWIRKSFISKRHMPHDKVAYACFSTKEESGLC